MRGPSIRPVLIAAAAIAGLVTFLSADVGTSPGAALASHAGGADSFLIDMDPTGNTATSVGAVQDCARINKNGVQDADEDAIDTVFADVVALNIPATHPIIAFEVTIRHGTGIVIDSGDFSQMLAANPGSSVSFTDVFQTGPDTTVLRAHDPQAPFSATAETGSGVLVRAAFRATTLGPLVQSATLRGSAHIDPANDAFVPDNSYNASPPGSFDYWVLPSSRIAVDQPCPPPLGSTDVAVTNVQVVASPAAPFADEHFSVQTMVTLTNSGPLTVSDYVVKALPALLGCSDLSGGVSLTTGPPVSAGGSISVLSTRTYKCSAPGIVDVLGWTFVVVLDAIDVNLGNNSLAASPSQLTILINDPDGDGVGGSADLCPQTAPGASVDGRGCSLAQVDSDGDGVCNDNAPSNGPSPGCVRSVAVGGVMGLLDGGTAPIASAEPVGLNGAHMRIAMIRAALIAMVLVGVGVWRLRRRA